MSSSPVSEWEGAWLPLTLQTFVSPPHNKDSVKCKMICRCAFFCWDSLEDPALRSPCSPPPPTFTATVWRYREGKQKRSPWAGRSNTKTLSLEDKGRIWPDQQFLNTKSWDHVPCRNTGENRQNVHLPSNSLNTSLKKHTWQMTWKKWEVERQNTTGSSSGCVGFQIAGHLPPAICLSFSSPPNSSCKGKCGTNRVPEIKQVSFSTSMRHRPQQVCGLYYRWTRQPLLSAAQTLCQNGDNKKSAG